MTLAYECADLATAEALIAAIDLAYPPPAKHTYAEPIPHPDGVRFAVPANAGGANTEAMRTGGLLPLGTAAPVTLDASWNDWPETPDEALLG